MATIPFSPAYIDKAAMGDLRAAQTIKRWQSVPTRNTGASVAPTQNTGSTVRRSAPDPLAALRAGFNTQKQNIYGTATDAARAGGSNLQGSILDFVDSLRSGQRGIDTAAVNNELAKRQGTSSVLGMVGRGIKSGGVMLANKNAGDSSASGALAQAYGDQGRRQLTGIGNQYELGNRDIADKQLSLDEQRNTFVNRKYGESKEQIVNGIVEQARNALAGLDAAMLEASIPERIQIEQEKTAIKNSVLGELQKYDQFLRDQVGKVRATSTQDRRARAAELQTAGYDLGEGAFDFTDEAPAQFQNGPYASELPIFTRPRRLEA